MSVQIDFDDEDVKCLGDELPYEKFLKEWKKHFNQEFDINDSDGLELHLRNYKLIKYYDFSNEDKSWENLNFQKYLKNGKKIINKSFCDIQKCICKVQIKKLYYITDIDNDTSPIIIIGSVCMKKWNVQQTPVCGICNQNIPSNSRNKLICKKCCSKKCYECHGDIDNNNQYTNDHTFVYYFTPHVPENKHYGYDPQLNKQGISLCGDCKTTVHKVCRRCGTNKIGYNRKTGECYYYCYKCREINRDNYTKNQKMKQLTELYGFS